MPGSGNGGLKMVQGDPVSYLECPRCSFPLNTCFSEKHLNDGKATVCYVACSRCMWAERWGELKKHQEGIDDARRSAAG